MNYFEFYELPISFNPDQNLVKQKFYALSKTFHPDFYINESEEKQQEVLDLSTINNKAFQVLKDPQKRLHYILELKGEINDGDNYALPQDFLMEMMEVNEVLMDLQFDPDEAKLSVVKNQIIEIETSLMDNLNKLTNQFDEADATTQTDLIKLIKDIYYRKKYLKRIQESLSKIN